VNCASSLLILNIEVTELSTATSGHYYQSSDGLNIFYRDYGGQNDGTPVICLPGLTRNSRDFDDLANYLSNRRRVITVDFRGRGFSDYDPTWQNYHPLTYVADIWTLLDLLSIRKVIVVGTSLGGLCAMVMAAQQGERIAGVVMNDIGPEINPAGIARISEYTGRAAPVTSWTEAAQQTKEIYGEWLPGLSDDDFMRLARRGFREIDSDIPRLDMDANIGQAIREVGPQKGDPWELFSALQDVPVTLLWGVLSDVLTEDIIEKMKVAKPDIEVTAVANRGHVPLLDEPESLSAIDEFLSNVA
jgi:pimeloyl-ACP methyl ester carboxylesterase